MARSRSTPRRPDGETGAPWTIVRVFGLAISAGLVLGFLLGIGRGLQLVLANRYVELGLSSLILDSLRDTVNSFLVSVPLLFALAAAIGVSVFLAARWRHASRVPALRITAATLFGATAILLGCLFSASKKHPWYAGILSSGDFSWDAVAWGSWSLLLASGLVLLSTTRDPLLRACRSLGRSSALLAVLAAAGLNAAVAAGPLSGPSGPNVLLITVDTLRADHLGAYGYVRDTSPHIDALAREGSRFELAFAQWPKTSPSFASMLTGTYGYTNGVEQLSGGRLPDRFAALGEVFKNAGYETMAAVTNGNLGTPFNFHQGFDTYVEAWRMPAPEGRDPNDAEFATQHALDWLASRRADRPFFMWLHYTDPHARYTPPPPHDEMFVGDAYYDPSVQVQLNEDRNGDIGGAPARAHLGDVDTLAYYVAQYDAEIHYTDEQIGRVLAELDRRGLSRRTVIALTADHGESLGEHDYFFEHGRLAYDAAAHVPLIVKVPGTAMTPVVRDVVELVDLKPTLLELAGAPVPPDTEGRSAVPLLRGDEDAGRRYAFIEAGYRDDHQRSLRERRWKLIYVPDPKDRAIMDGTTFELYDTLADPSEAVNLIEREPEIAEELKDELFRRMAIATGAEPPPETRPTEVDGATEDLLRDLGYID